MPLPSLPTIQATLPQLDHITLLTQGGQKIVYRAQHDQHGAVVLKLILDPHSNPRTLREIEVAQQCQITHVPQLYTWGDITEGQDTTMYLIEQYVAGETLRTRLQRQGQLAVPEGLALLHSLLQTMVELEGHQVVHRDIKPENIILGSQGDVWLLDFGIARHLGRSSLTATASPFGPSTLGYAAPEQFRNQKPEIDSRADLFAIGVVLYEVLAGVHPFRQGAVDRFDVMRRIEQVRPPLLQLPGDDQQKLARFIAMLMEPHVSRRPRTAQVALEWAGRLGIFGP